MRATILTRWALISAVLLACAGLGVALGLGAPRSGLAAARARWAERGYGHYRLATAHTGGLLACRQDAEIMGERVLRVLANSCPRAPMTVAGLFLEIERYNIAIGGQCGPNGCACDGPIAVEARFDPQLGAPTHIAVASQPQRRWQYLAYWRGLLSGGCTLVGFSGPTIEVLALTPLGP